MTEVKEKKEAQIPRKAQRDNAILAYYQGIKSGNIVVSQWIERIYGYIIKGLENKTFFFNQKKANAAIRWIEKHCFHVEGVLAPKNLHLELWQRALVSAIFGIVDERENRQFREIVLIVARKNGKSLLASAIARYEWHIDGGYGAKVFCLAPKLEQAAIVYDSVWQMELLDPEYKAKKEEFENNRDEHNKRVLEGADIPKHRQSDLFIQEINSSVKKIAFSAKKSDGFNPSLTICDEIASWQGEQGLRQYEVMKSAMGARPEGMMLSVSTAGYVSGSIYDELIARCTSFLLGNSKEKKLLPFLYMIDDIDCWNDINELRKSNPNMGVSVPVDYLIEEIAIAEGSLSKKAEFICKYCNIKQNSSTAWLDAQVVKGTMGEELQLEDFHDCYCVGGIDLSQTTDLTAATCVIEKAGELYVFAKFWLPAEKIEDATIRDNLPYNMYLQRGLLALSGDNFVDYRDCFQWFKDLVEQYSIYPLQVGYDRYSAQYLVNDMIQYGFHMDDVFQGENLYPVLQEFEGMLKDGKIHIGNNDLLAIHLMNSAIKMSLERGRGKLVKISPTEHIDGCAALIDAFTVRQKWDKEIGERLKNGA